MVEFFTQGVDLKLASRPTNYVVSARPKLLVLGNWYIRKVWLSRSFL
jgi:hypothetical protein